MTGTIRYVVTFCALATLTACTPLHRRIAMTTAATVILISATSDRDSHARKVFIPTTPNCGGSVCQ